MFTEFGPITNTGYSEKVDAAVARVPYVEQAVDVVGFDGTLQVLGHHHGTGVPGEAPPAVEGSTGTDAAYFSTDRVTVLQGRMADPTRSDEIVMSAGPPPSTGCTSGPPCRWPSSPTPRRANRTSAVTRKTSPTSSSLFKLVGIVEWRYPGRPGRRCRARQPDRGHHPRADQAARDVLRLLLVRLVPSRRRIGARSGRRLCREQGHPRPGPRGRNDHERPVRREGRARHPPRSHRPRGVRAHRRPRRAGDQRSGDQPPDPAQRRGGRDRARPGSRARHGDGRRARRRRGRDRGRVAPGRGGRRGAVPAGPDRPGPARLPRHRRGLRLDRPRSRVPLVRRGAHGDRAARRLPGGAAPVGAEAGHPRPGPRLDPGRRSRAPPERGAGDPFGAWAVARDATPHRCAPRCSARWSRSR